MNRFKVVKDATAEFEEVWRGRDSHLGEMQGFVEFHLLRGPEAEDHVLYASHTVWHSKADFEAWTRSDQFRKAHSRAPCRSLSTSGTRTSKASRQAKRATPLIALRNAALVAVAYDTLLRRSELVSLYKGDLHKGADGSGTVLVRRSEADQEGERAIKYLAPDTMAHLAAWLAAAQLESGPLFRPLSKGGQVGASAPGSGEVARVFRDLAGAAGLKLARVPSGHSTRVGATQDMFAAGFELLEAMPARYGERLRAQRGAARKLATLQNRA